MINLHKIGHIHNAAIGTTYIRIDRAACDSNLYAVQQPGRNCAACPCAYTTEQLKYPQLLEIILPTFFPFLFNKKTFRTDNSICHFAETTFL